MKPKKTTNAQVQDDIVADEMQDVAEEGVLEPDIAQDSEDASVIDKKLYDELMDRLQRNMAEFDNFRKRTAKEKAGMYDDAVRDTVEKILPAIDNLERAITASASKEDSFYKGVEMIFRQLENVLIELGVEILPAIGEPFDPNIHFAVAHADDTNFGENEVMEVMQKGYQYKNKVIRHSMVKVAN